MDLLTAEDLTLDPANANGGSLRGAQLLSTSLEQYGAGRPIVVDAHGVVIAGNQTAEEVQALGLPIHVVPSDGTALVVVVRTDLDLATDPKARALAYLDNRAGEMGLTWKPDQIAADLAAGVDLSPLWTDVELRALLPDPAETPDPDVPVLSATLTFDTPVQYAQWLHAVGIIAAGPGATFADQLDAWVTTQMAVLNG